MKMSDYRACCGQCFDLIGKNNPSSAKVWLNLCKIIGNGSILEFHYEKNKTLLNYDEDINHIQNLEILGFLVSIDTDSSVLVKLTSKIIENQGIFFCGGNCGE